MGEALTRNEGRATGRAGLWKPMAGLLACALVLGIAFNAVNPAGVSWAGRAVRKNPPRYENETIGVSLEFGGVKPAPYAPRSSALTRTALTWPQVKASLEARQVALLDVRPEASYRAGHIPGAVSLPADSPPAAFMDFARKHAKARGVVVYADTPANAAAQNVAEILLSQHQLPEVKVMPGGYAEYRLHEDKPGKGDTP